MYIIEVLGNLYFVPFNIITVFSWRVRQAMQGVKPFLFFTFVGLLGSVLLDERPRTRGSTPDTDKSSSGAQLGELKRLKVYEVNCSLPSTVTVNM
jgi:hypothetical protein